MKRGIARASAAAAIGVAAVVATATPAQAASSQCFVGSSGNCTTGVLSAQPYGSVDAVVNNIGRWQSCPWRIRDVNTRVVVRSGTAAANTRIYSFVSGLSGYYQLELRGCLVSATGILSNNW